MKGFVRSLLHTGSLLLAAVAFLAALISAFVVIALGLVWWREGRLGERDWPILRAGLVATMACAALGGAAFWLSRRATGSRKEGVRSFTLVRTRSGRQEKFVTYFGAVIYLTVLGLWLWSRGSSGPWLRGAQVFGWLGLLFLGLHTRILLHELGHLGIARLLRLELLRTQIGTGPVLCHGRLASGFEWSWQLWPGGGLAEAVDLEERGFRRRHFLFIAGGPVADALLLWAGYALFVFYSGRHAWPRVFAESAGFSVAGVLFLSTALTAVLGLVPHQTRIGHLKLPTDGALLLWLLRLDAAAVPPLVLQQTWRRVETLWAAGQQERAWAKLREAGERRPGQAATLAALEGMLRRDEKNFTAAAACFERALFAGGDLSPSGRLALKSELTAAYAAAGEIERARCFCEESLASASPENRAELLDALACVPIIHGIHPLLTEAERWSAEAMTLAPERLTVRGTRGSILVELGRLEEAESLLQEVFQLTESPRDRGIAAFYLAVVAKHRVRPRELARFRRLATRLCPEIWLLKRVRAELPDSIPASPVMPFTQSADKLA